MSASRSTLLLAAVLAGVAGYYVGLRRGLDKSFLRDRHAANEPEITGKSESQWAQKGEPTQELQESTEPTPASEDASEGEAHDVPAPPFVLDAARPVRISWPLDIGPDIESDRKDDRLCLRARSGVNEIQEPGTGWALYGFRIREAGKYQAFCRVRWTTDGVSIVACNNSWFLRYDGQPAQVLGGEQDKETQWQWVAGKETDFSAGVHWVRVELREDGPLMDRVMIAPSGSAPDESWHNMQPVTFGELAGERPPLHPEHAINDTEFSALPLDSLVIGEGHENTIRVAASWQSSGQDGFEGSIRLFCGTSPELVVEGESELSCDSSEPYATRQLRLQFPPDTDQRSHRVDIEIVDQSGLVVFRETIPFLKGYSWAFLGPFKDFLKSPKGVYRTTGSIRRLAMKCDKNPIQLANRAAPDALGLSELSLAPGHESLEWKVIQDGSCYDWTGAVDLGRVYGPVENAFAYATTWVNAEIALNHRSFNFQPDDSGWLWVNGHFLAEMPADLPREANRLWTSAKLEPGPNPVVIKLAQNRRYWGFRFDVIDWHWQGRRGDVIRGVDNVE